MKSEKRICAYCGKPLPQYVSKNRKYHVECQEARRQEQYKLRYAKREHLTQSSADESISSKEAERRALAAMKDPAVRSRVDQLLRESANRSYQFSRVKSNVDPTDPFDPMDYPTVEKDHPLSIFLPKRTHPKSKGVRDDSPRRYSTHINEEGTRVYVESRGTGFYGGVK